MTGRRSATVWRGVASLVALGSLLAGVPTMLFVTAGVPLPHGLPSWSQFTAALTQTGIPDSAILEGLAVLCWLLWLDLALVVFTEALAASRGRPLPLPAFARPLQPLAAYLIASVVLAVSVVSSRPVGPTVPGLRAALGATAGQQDRSVPLNGNQQAVEIEGQPAARSVATDEATSPPVVGTVGGDYSVRSGDTLWDIAARKLGDPLRWPEIFQLNRGRVEADGRRFTSPHWIWPRWILELPATAAGRPTPPPTAGNGAKGSVAAVPRAPSRSPSATPGTGQPPTPDVRPTSTPAAHPAPAVCHSPVPTPPGRSATPPSPEPAGTGSQAPPSRPQPAQSVTLPTGDIVGAALAAGIVAAIAAARLRGRRFSAGSPASRAAYLGLLTPVVRRLAAARWRPQETSAEQAAEGETLAPVSNRPEQPGVVVIGEAHGNEVSVDIGQLSGTGFVGEGASGVLRHLIVAFLQHAAPDRAEVTVVERAATLAPSASEVPAVKAVPDCETAVRRLEVELVQRTRTLDEHEVPDFATLVSEHPAEPLPALLVVAPQHVDDAVRARLDAVIGMGRRLGIGIVFCGSSSQGATLTIDPGGFVRAATGGPLAGDRCTRLYTLSPTAAAELLTVIAASRGAPLPATVDAETALPETSPPSHHDHAAQPPVHVSLFAGLPVVRVRGVELDAVLRRVTPRDASPTDREGLRRRGREILAFLALHPDGATQEQVLAELFPDEDPKTALDRLRRDIFNIREVLRRATQLPDAKFLMLTAERYQLDAELIDTDVWQAERAFGELREHGSASDHAAVLRRVLTAYGGQLLGSAPYEWVSPGLRENYVRRVVDAGQRLSRALEESGDIDGAIDAAERALAADRDDEELYRRLIALHLASGRRDAARHILRELEAHLSDIDAEPAEETVRLLEQ